MTELPTLDVQRPPPASDGHVAENLSPRTLWRFLLGHRKAIEQTARSGQAFWLGLLFVLSAGLAREYDGEYLRAEPWHLALPLAASIASSAILFIIVWEYLSERERAPFWREYRRFLTLYWMTAPLAWVYALPVERIFSAEGSVRANLLLLGLVAAWRVILMIRILSVLYAPNARSATVVVLSFGDALMLLILYLTPIPVIQIMGGVRLTEAQSLLQSTSITLGFLGVVAIPILLIGLLLIARTRWHLPQAADEFRVWVTGGSWALALGALVVWIPVLPMTQREQFLRWQVESAMASGQLEQGLAIMSAHDQSQFPPHWDPPPRIAYDYSHGTRKVLQIMSLLEPGNAREWVVRSYSDKFTRLWSWYSFNRYWQEVDDEEAELFVSAVESLSLQDRRTFLEHIDLPNAEASPASEVDHDADRRGQSSIKRALTKQLLEMQASMEAEA